MSIRTVLRIAVLACLALWLTSQLRRSDPITSAPFQQQEATDSFSSPESISSRNGELKATLVVDGKVGRTGPTLRARPGDLLKLRIENKGSVAVGHFHVQRSRAAPEEVRPQMKAIEPCGSREFVLAIPAEHAPGIQWYQAGQERTAAPFLAGALIIEGGLDVIDEIQPCQERIFCFQQIPHTTINGVTLPILTMRPGEVQRWRFLHAGSQESLLLRLDGHCWSELAVDGLALGKSATREEIELQPGYRSDALVQACLVPGTYWLRDAAMPASQSLHSRDEPDKFLAQVVVRGAPVIMKLPSNRSLAPQACYRPVDEEEIEGRESTLELVIEPHRMVNYFINGKLHDVKRPPQRVLGTAEEWVVSLRGDNQLFQLEGTPFEVVRRNPRTGTILERTWKDTLLLLHRSAVTIRTRYLDFPGKRIVNPLAWGPDRGAAVAIDVLPAPVQVQGLPEQSLPWQAPTWELPDSSGCRHRRAEGKPSLVIFHRGHTCLHCRQQMRALEEFAESTDAQGVHFIAISPDSVETLARTKPRQSERMLRLSDESRGVFRAFHCYAEDEAQHGIFLIDAAGRVVWYFISEEPFTDVARLRREIHRLLRSTNG